MLWVQTKRTKRKTCTKLLLVNVRATLSPNNFQVTRSTIKALCMLTTQDSLVGCLVQAEDEGNPLKELMLTSREVAEKSRVCTPRYQPW